MADLHRQNTYGAVWAIIALRATLLRAANVGKNSMKSGNQKKKIMKIAR